jgi:hypothetical protein
LTHDKEACAGDGETSKHEVAHSQKKQPISRESIEQKKRSVRSTAGQLKLLTVLEDGTYCELHIGHLHDQSYGFKVSDGGFCEIGNLSDCFSRKCRGELS